MDIEQPDKPVLITDAKVITPRMVHEQIRRFMDQIPDMAFVLIVGAKGDYSRVAQTRNVEPQAARQMLRVAIDGHTQGRVLTPRG